MQRIFLSIYSISQFVSPLPVPFSAITIFMLIEATMVQIALPRLAWTVVLGPTLHFQVRTPHVFSFNKRLDALGKKLSCWNGLHRFEWAARYCDTGQSLCTCYGWLTSKKKYFVANVCTQHNILLRMYAHNTTKHNPCEFTTWQDVKTFRAITKGRCLRGANEKLDFLKHTSRLMHQHL